VNQTAAKGIVTTFIIRRIEIWKVAEC